MKREIKQIKEYYTLSIEETGQETEDKLNELALDGWKLICSYAWQGKWLIMERNKKEDKSKVNVLIEKAKKIVKDFDSEDDILKELQKLKEKKDDK